jgi:hypothetical protein
MFLGLGRVILCAKCFPFRALADGCMRAPGTAIPHVPAAPFCAVGKLNGAKKSSGDDILARRILHDRTATFGILMYIEWDKACICLMISI